MKGSTLQLLYLTAFLIGCQQNTFFEPKEETLHFEVADILISEILPDPNIDGVEFVEIFNNSNKVIDLSSLQLATVNASGKRSKLHPISKSSLMMYPFTYKLLSLDVEKIKAHYPIQSSLVFHNMPSFPTLTNSQGSVLLLRKGNVIDSLYYNIAMHDVFIKNPKGVSLERVSFKKATNSPSNFVSAAASTNYATPGYRNSQSGHEEPIESSVFLTAKSFSPNNGESLTINFHFMESQMTNVFIYNQTGKRVRYLLTNHRLGTKDQILWDGKDDQNNLLPLGVYHVYIEIYDKKGGITKYKKSCIIASKVTS